MATRFPTGTALTILAVVLVGVRFVTAAPAEADADSIPTFTRDIAPILYAECATCHRPGGAGPFELLDYDDVRGRAGQLVAVTETGYMPPWLPEEGYGDFVGERRLTAEERDAIAAWAAAGAPEGRAEDLPEPPAWPTGWQLGPPDLVVSMPRTFTLGADGEDVFRNFVVPSGVDRQRWIRGFEFRPTNPKVVHHAVIRTDPTRSSRRLDAADPEPGYEGMPGAGASEDVAHFVGWTPGNQPELGDGKLAWGVAPGTDLVFHLHLLPTGKPEDVGAEMGLYFSERPPERWPMLLRLGSRAIDLPAGEAETWLEDAFELPTDIDVLGVYPHAHYLGERLHGWAERPDGEREWLIRIDRWDFNWQDDYRYREPVRLPAGTRLRSAYAYDNSDRNPRNPNTPPQRVLFGPRSSDEMGDLWLQVVPVDESQRAMLQAAFDAKELRVDIAGYRKALEIEPDDVETLAELGLLEWHSGDESAAESSLQRALALLPDHPRANLNAGLVLQERGELDRAIAHYRRAIAVDPRSILAHNNLGTAYRAQGRLGEAIAEYRAVLMLEPDHPTAHNNLGVALQASRRVDEAIVEYRRAATLDKGALGPRINLARALGAEGEWSEAVSAWDDVLAIDPTRSDLEVQRGHARLAAGQPAAAVESYRTALGSRPDDLQARTALAVALARLGNKPEALATARGALADAPEGREGDSVRQTLRRLIAQLER